MMRVKRYVLKEGDAVPEAAFESRPGVVLHSERQSLQLGRTMSFTPVIELWCAEYDFEDEDDD